MIGLLSPDGLFYECNSFEHSYKAKKICEQNGYIVPFAIVNAEEHLLNLGWLIIRVRDVYMNYHHSGDRSFIILTDEQIKWIGDNTKEFNDNQKKDISKILIDQDDLRRWKEAKGENGFR